MGKLNIMVSEMGLGLKSKPVIFQYIGPDMGLQPLATWTTFDTILCHLLHVIGTTPYSMTIHVLILQEPHETFCNKTT